MKSKEKRKRKKELKKNFPHKKESITYKVEIEINE